MKYSEMKCLPCESGTPPITSQAAARMVKKLPKGWQVAPGAKALVRRFRFKSYPETIAFVNLVALIAQEEGHHPDMVVNYGNVTVEFSTHSIKGLSENDFIMAAKLGT